MHRKTPRILAILLTLLVFPAAGAVRLKTRTLDGPPEPTSRPLKRGNLERSHYLVQMDGMPGPATIAAWNRRGIRVTGYVPDSAVVLSVPDAADVQVPGVQWVSRLSGEDKVSPAVRAAGGPEQATDAYVVDFYPDVDMDVARQLINDIGLRTGDHPNLLPYQLLVLGGPDQVAGLADWDEVAYIFPASQDLVSGNPVVGCPGAATAEGLIAQYVKAGAGWSAGPNGVVLNYMFTALTPKLPPSTVESEVLRAFNEWSKYARLAFTPGSDATAARTIAILFASGPHGDGYPFDNIQVLAHTFYPSPPNPEPIAGDMHFNADEAWDNPRQIDLYTVALHETGHALGLAHSDRPGAIMYPYYRAGAQIADDDIAGIRALYEVTVPSGPTAAPLALTISNPASSSIAVTAPSIAMAGTTIGGVGNAQVTWRSSRGPAGTATGSAAWNIAAIPLSDGLNVISVTATDSAQSIASKVIAVSKVASSNPLPSTPPANPPVTPNPTAPGAPTGVPPALRITSPAFTIVSTSAPSITIKGTSSSDTTRVTWSNSVDGSGTAAGTANWQADVPLVVGTNTITVRAYNSTGTSWRSLTVVRR